jgi:anti-sigma B factor antagonist
MVVSAAMTDEHVVVEVGPCGEGTLVRVRGVLDALSLPQVSRELTDAQRGSGTVYVDLAGVTFMDSRGLGSLLAANERSREGAADVRIYQPSDAVRRLLEVSGVGPVLTEVSELPATPQ